MAELGLLVNKFNISNRSGEFFNLYTPFNEHKSVDLIDKLEEYLQKVFQPVHDDNKDHAMGMGSIIEKKVVTKEGRPYYKYLYFSVSYGQYGTSADIKEIETGTEVFHLEPNHVPYRDFCVYIAMPYDEEKADGIIIFESISGNSVKTMFSKSLKEFARKLDDKFSFKISPLASEEEIKALINSSNMDKVRLIKYGPSKDHIDKPFAKEERIFFTPVGKFRDRVLKMLLVGHMNSFEIAALDNFEADDLKVQFTPEGGNPKTIGIKNVMGTGLTVVINEHHNLKLDSGKLPTKNSLLTIITEECENLIEKLK